MARYALGIDGGGSKCDVLLVDETGQVVGRGRGGPTHVYYDPPEVITRSYVDAISAALRGVQNAEIWSAGHLPHGSPRDAITARNLHIRHIPASEQAAAFAAAGEEWGCVVLSGTGSFVHARSPDGREVHFGGLGPVLDDYGSAYEIGLRGLRAAFASAWAPSRRTSLAAAVPRALGVEDLRQVFDLVYRRGLGRREIAALAKVVDQEAERGDAVAISCVQRAADELADLAVDALLELGLGELPVPVIAVGSVARRSRLWWTRICERLAQVAPQMRPLLPRLALSAGAAIIALRAMGIADTPELRARLAEGGGDPVPG